MTAELHLFAPGEFDQDDAVVVRPLVDSADRARLVHLLARAHDELRDIESVLPETDRFNGVSAARLDSRRTWLRRFIAAATEQLEAA